MLDLESVKVEQILWLCIYLQQLMCSPYSNFSPWYPGSLPGFREHTALCDPQCICIPDLCVMAGTWPKGSWLSWLSPSANPDMPDVSQLAQFEVKACCEAIASLSSYACPAGRWDGVCSLHTDETTSGPVSVRQGWIGATRTDCQWCCLC